jgi:hypothetical protein
MGRGGGGKLAKLPGFVHLRLKRQILTTKGREWAQMAERKTGAGTSEFWPQRGAKSCKERPAEFLTTDGADRHGWSLTRSRWGGWPRSEGKGRGQESGQTEMI